NGVENIVDLLPKDAGGGEIDPAPPRDLVVEASPRALRFAPTTGDAVAQADVAIENVGENPLTIVSVELVGAPGAAVHVPSAAPTLAARRFLDGAAFASLAPGATQFLGVTY